MLKYKNENSFNIESIGAGGKDMISNSFDEQKIMDLIVATDLSYIRDLIENGGDPNGDYNVNGINVFPLAFASSKEKADLLINSGADVNKTNNKGQTALMLNKNTEVAFFLIQSGADCKKLDDNGRNAIFYHLDDLFILKHLILKGANPIVKDKNGITAYSLMSDSFKESYKTMLIDYQRMLSKLKENKEKVA